MEITGSQGVHQTDFVSIVEGSPVDEGNPVSDPEYNKNGVSIRQITARNTPTMINAVFTDRNFWDGRANHYFNGVNPFGDLDPNARVWEVDYRDGIEERLQYIFANYSWAQRYESLLRRYKWITNWFLPRNWRGAESLAQTSILLNNASLASQAVGPPLSDVEMSWIGRTFPDLGRKMLTLPPLALQQVHPNDSVLGSYAENCEQGLDPSISYGSLIRQAFHRKWWGSQDCTPDGYTQMEANFSLYWGLAVMMYESTLVSDDTPFDHYAGGDKKALTATQKRGLEIFTGAGRCANCHGGPEFTGATVSQIRGVLSPEVDVIEFMKMQRGPEAFYDNGFYNIGVRPTLEDLGVGAAHPDFGPLSYVRQRQNGRDVDQNIDVPGNARVAVDGAFKTPSLRNIELTGPYMHNGGMRTLTEVVQFYTRGADFFHQNIDDLDPDVDGISELQGNPDDIQAVVEFMKALTDERVRYECAPFDHPELVIPNGHDVSSGTAVDENIVLPAVGADGGEPILPFDEIVSD